MPAYDQMQCLLENATTVRSAAKLSRSPELQRFTVPSMIIYKSQHPVEVPSLYQALDTNMAAGFCTAFGLTNQCQNQGFDHLRHNKSKTRPNPRSNCHSVMLMIRSVSEVAEASWMFAGDPDVRLHFRRSCWQYTSFKILPGFMKY
jgi:hypothetical protein